jgi:N-acetyl-gamma-glutamyl-phosphate reductase
MRVGIVGASGYSGGELLRYLAGHPFFEVDFIAAGSNAGQPIDSVHPHLNHLSGRDFESLSLSRANEVELLFIALPHGESSKIVSHLDPHVKVVDLGADFRLQEKGAWERYYGGEYAGSWVYGLPELPSQREKISQATRIANPGCYATAIILAAAPMVAASAIESSDITVVAASGTTGAGRSAKTNLLASEVMGALTSYKFGGIHQHTPEIEQALSSLGSKSLISFTPILAPMPRGILATVTAKTSLRSNEAVMELFTDFYRDEEFVHVLGKSMPKTSSVVGSNNLQISVAFDAHTSRWIASAAIDNLGKGAAGQAIQNANLMAGFPENSGLSKPGIGS